MTGELEHQRGVERIAIIDLVVFAAEHWIVIFLLPVMVTVVLYLVLVQGPATYEATITISVPGVLSDKSVSTVYDAIRMQDDSLDIQVQGQKITIVGRGKSAGDVVNKVSNAGKSLAVGILEGLASDMEHPSERIEMLQRYLEDVRGVDTSSDAPLRAVAALWLQTQLETERSLIERAREDVELRLVPIVTATRLGRPPHTTAILSGLATAGVAVALSLIRAFWKSAVASPLYASKLARIRRAFFLSR